MTFASKSAWRVEAMETGLVDSSIRVALRFLPADYRNRYRDEWYAELDEMERGEVSRCRPALRILLNAPAMGWALRADGRHQAAGLPSVFSTGEQRAWLVFAHAATILIDPSTSCILGSRLPRHVKVGDLLVLRNEVGLLGAGVIDQVSERDEFRRSGCRKCFSANLVHLREFPPLYRCMHCGELSRYRMLIVTKSKHYATSHGRTWVAMRGLLSNKELAALCVNPKAQSRIQELRPGAFETEMASRYPESLRYPILARATNVT